MIAISVVVLGAEGTVRHILHTPPEGYVLRARPLGNAVAIYEEVKVRDGDGKEKTSGRMLAIYQNFISITMNRPAKEVKV